MIRHSTIVIAFLGVAGLAFAQNPHPNAESLKKKTTKWLEENNAFGPKHPLVKDLVGASEKTMKEGKNFSLVIGPKLTKSGKGVAMTSWGDELFTFELTDEQHKKTQNAPGGAKFTEGAVVHDLVRTPRPVLMTMVSIKDGPKVDGSKELRGEIAIDVKKEIEEKVALRLTYTIGGTATSKYFLIERRLPNSGKGTVLFTFGAMNAEKDKKGQGPVIAIFDLCNPGDANKDEPTVLSNSRALLVDVQ